MKRSQIAPLVFIAVVVGWLGNDFFRQAPPVIIEYVESVVERVVEYPSYVPYEVKKPTSCVELDFLVAGFILPDGTIEPAIHPLLNEFYPVFIGQTAICGEDMRFWPEVVGPDIATFIANRENEAAAWRDCAYDRKLCNAGQLDWLEGR